jgi:hypothetical protein
LLAILRVKAAKSKPSAQDALAAHLKAKYGVGDDTGAAP